MINFSFENITPELATRLLDEHDTAVEQGEIVNRHRKASAVRRIAADIMAAQWFPQTGETLKFEKNGTGFHGRHLVDGQTRLAACVQAQRPIDVWIASGVEREAFVYIDSGEKRSLKDVLKIKGETEAITLAPALSWLHRWDFSADTLTNRSPVSHAHATKLLEADPAIRKSAARVRDISLIGRGLSAFLHRIFTKKDPALAEKFIEAIATGQNLSATDPFYVLRERLIAEKATRRKLRQTDLIALAIKAWNAAREQKTIKRLNVKPGETVVLL